MGDAFYSVPETQDGKNKKQTQPTRRQIRIQNPLVNDISETEFPSPPPVPQRSHHFMDVNYEYDQQTVEMYQQPTYEVPNDEYVQDATTDSLSSELSDIVILHEEKNLRFWGKTLFFSIFFGFVGGMLGGLVMQPQNESIFAVTQDSTTECFCTPGNVFFSFLKNNSDPCYAIANGQADKYGNPTPNLMQKNGLFVRAGENENVGLVEEDGTNLDSARFVTSNSIISEFPPVYSEQGSGLSRGFFLPQNAIWGVTGSAEGQLSELRINTNVTAFSDMETKPVSIRLLPLICI